MKRVQLIPLIIMLWCSGISLSSGLCYYEANIAVFLFPVGLMFLVYYLLRIIFQHCRRKELWSLSTSFALSLISLLIARGHVIPGLLKVFHTFAYRVYVCYDINFGVGIKVDQTAVETLAVCQLIVFVTVVSLYLYETHRPSVVTALPSFLLFSVAIIADGVPYETCVVAYGGALVIFLGMGRGWGGVRKLLLLSGCTAIVVVVVGSFVSWSDVSEGIWQYRNQLTTMSNMRSMGSVRGGGGEKQIIDFGQFNKKGDIKYNGTIELYVTCEEDLQASKLFLRGFIGQTFQDNIWTGLQMMDHIEPSTYGDGVPIRQDIEIENVFDTGFFLPFAVSDGQYEEWMQFYARMNRSHMSLFQELLYISDTMKNRIWKTVLMGKKFGTIGQAVEVVRNYFGEGFQYTLHPGELRNGEDEIERFMFVTKKGYCTHFASAAAMIFRSMGIPARIAQGYMIGKDRVLEGEQISVYDYNAHAWTEIYVDGEGWIPLDVTSYVVGGLLEDTVIPPGQREESQTEQPDAGRLKEPHKQEEPDPDREKKQKEKKAGQSGENAFSFTLFFGKNASHIVIYGTVVLFCAFAAFVAVFVWRKHQYRRLRQGMESGDFSERLLFINDNLRRFWKTVKAPWDYEDSDRRIQNIYWTTGKYYPPLLGREETRALQGRIQRYVLCVFTSRFGNISITEEQFGDCMDYLSEMIGCMKDAATKKHWKKLQRCDMVKIIYKLSIKQNKKSGGRQYE